MTCGTLANFTEGKRREMLEWLSEVKCEDHHAEVVKTRLERTGMWLLRRHEIRNWRESEESSILWLHGKGNIIYLAHYLARAKINSCVQLDRGRRYSGRYLFPNYGARHF